MNSYSRILLGGQLSRRKPSDKPLEANTSLISVNDFFPKLGVLEARPLFSVLNHQCNKYFQL